MGVQTPAADSWKIGYQPLGFPSRFIHLLQAHRAFPGAGVNWKWISAQIASGAGAEFFDVRYRVRGAGIDGQCAQPVWLYRGGDGCGGESGCAVCHVDAAEGMVKWCRENAR
jgi:23S rRNA (cytosine1962-C5)-methyltransferase